MTDEQHTDDRAIRAKLALTLGYVVDLVFRTAKALVEEPTVAAAENGETKKDAPPTDAATRRLTALVIALGRITEMDDRYHDRAAARARTADERERDERAISREIQRLLTLSDDELTAELDRGALAGAAQRKADL